MPEFSADQAEGAGVNMDLDGLKRFYQSKLEQVKYVVFYCIALKIRTPVTLQDLPKTHQDLGHGKCYNYMYGLFCRFDVGHITVFSK